MNEPPLLVILGQTASGKSELALELARLLPVEIISADSMQVYRGMDIGTAKPSPAEQAAVPHHLIDLLDIHEPLDVYYYVEQATAALAAIRGRGKFPLLVGGSGLYARALLYGLDPLPADPVLRHRLDAEFAGPDGLARLELLMAERDAAALAACGGHHRKLLRALEVLELSGVSITASRQAWGEPKLRHDVRCWRANRPRAEVFERIGRRAAAMLADGWLEETSRLVAAGLLETPTARQAIGYADIAAHLRGELAFDALRERIVSATKKLARRQDTWFKRQHPEAVDIDLTQGVAHLAAQLKEAL